jgi:predicted transcriptional regulator of viral defense system
MSRSSREAARTLASIASGQGGYFTAKQAHEAGYNYPHLAYHVSTGTFERIEHGLYRLTTISRSDEDELIRLSLWSRDRHDAPQAVVSHESALVLHGLSELLPTALHVTVPPPFRKPAPRGVVLHKAAVAEDDTEERSGFRVTTPLRTLRDAAIGDVSQEQLDKAVADALSRGLVRKSELVRMIAGAGDLARLRLALRTAAG